MSFADLRTQVAAEMEPKKAVAMAMHGMHDMMRAAVASADIQHVRLLLDEWEQHLDAMAVAVFASQAQPAAQALPEPAAATDEPAAETSVVASALNTEETQRLVDLGDKENLTKAESKEMTGLTDRIDDRLAEIAKEDPAA